MVIADHFFKFRRKRSELSKVRVTFFTIICVATVVYLVLFHEGLRHKMEGQSAFNFDISDNLSYVAKKEGLNKFVGVQELLHIQKNLGRALKIAQRKMFTILVWWPPFGVHLDDDVIDFEKCGNCEVIYDLDKITAADTKAVVFHFDETNFYNMPKRRDMDQLFVWWSVESPPSLRDVRHLNLLEYDDVFNLTMSYRRDSDVYFPYGFASLTLQKIQNKTKNQTEAIDKLVSEKRALATWIVTDCYETEGATLRWWLVNSLVDAGLNLDRYGGCFPEFYFKGKDVIRKYKFYIAFENSYHCRDYITEKVFENSFKYDAVPVVWGSLRSNYEETLPPKSFIFFDDFKTVKELVVYLEFLDRNVHAYKEYFKWRMMKPDEMPMYNRVNGMCQLCRIIHGINVDDIYRSDYLSVSENIPLFGFTSMPRIVHSLNEWFYNENKDCLPKHSIDDLIF